MGADCCGTSVKFDGLSADYKRRLWLVIVINAAMFLVEMGAGALAGSNALQADALDFLANSATYGISLAVIGASVAHTHLGRHRQGGKFESDVAVGTGDDWLSRLDRRRTARRSHGRRRYLALAANVTSVLILMRYKDGDANVRSVWLCSRNDAIGNVAVMIAALAVWGTDTKWPDLIVAAIMAGLFFYSSMRILQQSFAEMRHERALGHSH